MQRDGAVCPQACPPSSSTQSLSGSDFEPSGPSSEPLRENRRKRARKRKVVGNESDSSVDDGSPRMKGHGTDFFLTAGEKKRRKAAAEREAAVDLAKSAALRQQEAMEQLMLEKLQRMKVGTREHRFILI